MHYCGLDVSQKATHVYVEDGQGRRVKRAVVPTTPEGLEEAIARLVKRGLQIAIEAGNQTAWIVDLLRELGATVHMVHPLKVKLIAKSKRKTDRVDAQLLAHLLRIGGLPEPVHIPSWRSRELRGVLVARRQLVRMRTQALNVVRGLLRQQRVTLRARALLTQRGWAELHGTTLSPALRKVVAAYEATVAAVTTALAALERDLTRRAARDPRVARLETIPGVGPISAQTLVAAVDRIDRFPSAKKLVAYRGLAPSVRASGERVGVWADHEGGPERNPRGVGASGPRGLGGEGGCSPAAPALVRASRSAAGQEDGVGRPRPEAVDDRVSPVAGGHDVRSPSPAMSGVADGSAESPASE